MENCGVLKIKEMNWLHTVLQKALGEKFREEQGFFLVSIVTNSEQEGKGFLSSVHFSEASSAAQLSGGLV